jgi:hypothetical protein
MTTTDGRHEHHFKELILIPVQADNPGKREKLVDYAGIGTTLPTFGTVEPMGILARKCACGKQQVFEYGKRQAMRVLLQRLGRP